MKALILISSIFYLLGVKISHNIDLFKRTTKPEKIRVQEAVPSQNEKNIDFKEAQSISAQPEDAPAKALDPAKINQQD